MNMFIHPASLQEVPFDLPWTPSVAVDEFEVKFGLRFCVGESFCFLLCLAAFELQMH